MYIIFINYIWTTCNLTWQSKKTRSVLTFTQNCNYRHHSYFWYRFYLRSYWYWYFHHYFHHRGITIAIVFGVVIDMISLLNKGLNDELKTSGGLFLEPNWFCVASHNIINLVTYNLAINHMLCNIRTYTKYQGTRWKQDESETYTYQQILSYV